MDKISISPRLVRMTFAQFREWHKRTLPNDPMSSEDRYKSIGGMIPIKPKEPQKVTTKTEK
jgi:hypothetical protein